MKSMLGEYGKLIILVIAAVGLFVYFLGTGFRSQMQVVKPQENLKAASQSEKLAAQQDGEKATLTVRTEKLKIGEQYDLLSFCTEAYGKEDGRFPVEVVQITTPEGKNLMEGEVACDPGAFVPEEKGVYAVVYQASQWYQGGYPVQIRKTFRYLAA